MIDYTVIIPHYNSSEECKKLILTIPDKENIEVIVVDDKSTEYHLKQLEKLKMRKKLKLLLNISNKKGAGVARNIGLEKANGKWLIFADSDDFFLEGAFDIIEKYKNVKEDIVYFLVTSVFKGTNKIARRHIEFNNILESSLKNKNKKLLPFSPWSKMIKKELIKKNDIKFSEVIAANDALFSVKSNYYAESIKIVKEYIYCITRSSNSITMNNKKEYFYSRFNEGIKIDKFLREKGKNKLRRTFLRALWMSKRYGIKEIIKVFKKIRREKCKIFTRELISLVNPIYILKIYEKK